MTSVCAGTLTESEGIHLSEDGVGNLIGDCVRISLDLESEGTLSDEDAASLSQWADIIRRCDYEHGVIPAELERAYSKYIRSKPSGNERGRE